MELIVHLGDRRERVVIDAPVDDGSGPTVVVTVGDRRFIVDRRVITPTSASLLVDGAQFEVSVRAIGESAYRVASAGSEAEIEVLDPLADLAAAAHSGVEKEGGQIVRAYMPGRVVTLLVEEGDEVEAGQGLLVLEAMKMENEIQAEHAGKVNRILVEAGQPVDGGQALCELE
ncbi:MAG TPA: biotin/lipoyl-containing protein [Thermoanaerobaculia bacterium]|nr:biotin/lipoyl-containing protein [Thermoanaerobaculia bacterium]